MIKDPKLISIDNYTYSLPNERIAIFPLPERDTSKLLIAANDSISDDVFKKIPSYLPGESLVVFNDTRVVQARLIFYKKTGAKIEIFCLDPLDDSRDIQISLAKSSPVRWNCLVGNAKKWKNEVLQIEDKNKAFVLNASVIGKTEEIKQIEFSWEPKSMSFAEVLDMAGKTPLPPYIDREVIDNDKSRYQTIYANNSGSVAAPTAGLHFSDNVMQKLKEKEIETAKLTLHVGAGTFKPVSSGQIGNHSMHAEQILVSKDTLLQLKKYLDKKIISVGTTSVRTLETLYWWGVKLLKSEQPDNHFFDLQQWYPYEKHDNLPIAESAIDALLDYMDINNHNTIRGKTELIIVPGYDFKITDILITNFHQPGSTLLLLVAAFLGEKWKEAYKYAIDNDFRFLSYGDSCLFFKES